MTNIVPVGPDGHNVAAAPQTIETYNLSVCLAIVFYSRKKKTGAIIHLHYPRHLKEKLQAVLWFFENNSIGRNDVKVALIGSNDEELGKRNREKAHELLEKAGIEIAFEDTNQPLTRLVSLDTSTGKLKYIFKDKEVHTWSFEK